MRRAREPGFDPKTERGQRVDPAAHVYRLRLVHRTGVGIKGYRHTLEAVDEATDRVEASCDVFSNWLGVAVPIRQSGDANGARDGDGQDARADAEEGGTDIDPAASQPDIMSRARQWRLEPNQRQLPAWWTLHDPDGRVIVSFEGQALAKAANPLGRATLSVHDAEGTELFRLIDPRNGVAASVFGIEPETWALVDGPHLVASIGELPAKASQEASSQGLLGRLGALLTRSDRGLVSLGDGHVLPAPAVLCMVMLLDELTAPSAGA